MVDGKPIINLAEAPKYPPETAGRLMIASIPVVSPDDTISKVEEMLLKKVKEFETINYIYVVHKNGKLAGVISIKDILRQPKTKKVSEIMIKDLIVAHPYTDQERVAYLSLKNNIKAIPVVDKDGVLLGVVPSDIILAVTYNEASEDLLSLAGVSRLKSTKDNIMELSLFTLLKHRLPWLFLGLAGGILTARVIGLFENTLAENIILASFIPLIVYMGGAVLAQTQAFFIRDIALNPKLNFGQYFLKQLAIILSIALTTSVVLLIAGTLFYGNLPVVRVLGAALFAAITSSYFTGLIIPFIFSRFNTDPANASGPIATVVQDLIGVTLYFTIASLLL